MIVVVVATDSLALKELEDNFTKLLMLLQYLRITR